jgi:hypothetical protein
VVGGRAGETEIQGLFGLPGVPGKSQFQTFFWEDRDKFEAQLGLAPKLNISHHVNLKVLQLSSSWKILSFVSVQVRPRFS